MKLRSSQPDYSFIALVWILTLLGLVALLSASLILGKNRFNDPFYYLKHQLINGVFIGLLGFLITSRIYYRYWEKFALPIFLISLLLLILVFSPLGQEFKEARRWLKIGPLVFQPGEILKVTFLIYLSAWLAKRGQKVKSFFEGLFPFLFFLGILAGLFILQPATSTLGVIVIASFIVYFLSGARILHLLLVAFLVLLLLGGLVFLSPNYRTQRILSFFNFGGLQETSRDYHIIQSLLAIGSGGWRGVGFGNAVSKYNFLPEPIGDSIFAVIAQEFGFIGCLVLLTLYLLFFWRGIKIALKAPDNFGKFLTIGLVSLVLVQSFVNIGSMTKLLPLTGQPLPFISYGGTSLAILLTGMGIIVNISKYRR